MNQTQLSQPQGKNDSAGLSPAVLELLASRICHDIISPVGAVHNGIEFLQEMGPDAGEEAIDLISYSARAAAAKLQAFRMAYGAGGRDPSIKPEDVFNTFADLIRDDGKVTQSWDPYGDLGYGDDRPEAFCKILMGTLILATECMPKGGNISISGDTPGKTVLAAQGNDAAPRPLVIDALKGNIAVSDVDPRLVHPYALGILARHYGYEMDLEAQGGGRVEITLHLPR